MFLSLLFKSSPCHFLQSFKHIYFTLHTWKTPTTTNIIVLRNCRQKYVAKTPNTVGYFFPRNKRIRKEYTDAIDIVIENNQEKIDKIATLMSCSIEQAEKLVRADSRLVTVISFQKVQTTISKLRQAGFSADSVIKYSGIFSRNLGALQRRLDDMQLFRKYHYSMECVFMGQGKYEKIRGILLREAILMGQHPTRLSYLSELLECSENQLQEAIASGYSFLRLRKLSALKAVVNLYVKNGITKKDIVDNITIFRLKPLDCKQRLKVLRQPYYDKEKKIEMLYKLRKLFYISHRKYSENQEALGNHEDKYHYLQERLNCSRMELELLFIKAPIMRITSPRRLKRVLDVLLDEFGFTTQTIFRNYHLLFFSENRLKHRWKILENFDLHESEKIADLILPKKKFEMKYHETSSSDEEFSDDKS
ncbi:uncharacterized protein LOC106877379 isoform X2 [Octopus bimaculoides]|uniref:Uncharacterized protein n=2 Tax=Octopus bimaculoides TaxID=37653 RepID=A0A0L8GEA5_OCTBM|nr:uncharacterized protein LOC106877379 isoform X2 [Octopus bimaculoides]|eukprot:XP_014781753.1 PREDICTED: uncharacterized protein LOC106877379 [Octopus bimaculoides]